MERNRRVRVIATKDGKPKSFGMSWKECYTHLKESVDA